MPRFIYVARTERRFVLPALIATLLILCQVSVFSQSTSGIKSLSANEFLQKTIDAELKAQSKDHSHWMYEVKTKVAGKDEVKWVVQTRDGDIDRLRSVDGQPISAEQEKQEERRIAGLVHKGDEDKKPRRAEQEDDRQMDHLLKMLPQAVIAKYGEHKGDMVELLYAPNADFHPSSHEDAVFHAMAGRIWVNEREMRLAEIEGDLIREVKFYGGLLGYLDQGGKFNVKQSEVAPGYWEVTMLDVNMHGKILFFKTISVQQNEIRSNLQRVPDNLTLAQAAEELQKRAAQSTANNGSHSSQIANGVLR